MPVEMHGVGSRRGVVDHDANGGVGAEVFDVPFGWVGEIATFCQK